MRRFAGRRGSIRIATTLQLFVDKIGPLSVFFFINLLLFSYIYSIVRDNNTLRVRYFRLALHTHSRIVLTIANL
jgi:hypothetical protein